MLGTGLETYDPEEAYRIDLMTGVRKSVVDRETVLSYVRNALAFEKITPELLERRFPAVLNAVSHLSEPPDTALRLISGLLNRHGQTISDVMRTATATKRQQDFPEGSLPNLYGSEQAERYLENASTLEGSIAAPPEPEKVLLQFDLGRKSLLINEVLDVKARATVALLRALAEIHLQSAGKGMEPLDYPFTKSKSLSRVLDIDGDEAVRKRVARARSLLRTRFEEAGYSGEMGYELIENSTWHGYRLRPEAVDVRIVGQD